MVRVLEVSCFDYGNSNRRSYAEEGLCSRVLMLCVNMRTALTHHLIKVSLSLLLFQVIVLSMAVYVPSIPSPFKHAETASNFLSIIQAY